MAIANTGKIINILTELAEYEGLQVAVTESAKGALLAGTCAFIGGLVGGPVGIGIGGVIGAVTAANRAKGKFKPVAHVIMHDMSSHDRQRLAQKVGEAVISIGTSNDILMLLSMASTNDTVKMLVLDTLRGFLRNQGYSLC